MGGNTPSTTANSQRFNTFADGKTVAETSLESSPAPDFRQRIGAIPVRLSRFHAANGMIMRHKQ